MAANRFTHVSIHAYDFEESLRFYEDVFGMRRVPSPDFSLPVEWLELGDQQLHLFHSEDPAPRIHHIGLDVDDFEAVYRIAVDRGLFDRDAFGAAIDDPKDFFITLLNGITAAALYFIVASGFTLIFGLMRVVNMAHGAFFLLAAFIAAHFQRSFVGAGGGGGRRGG